MKTRRSKWTPGLAASLLLIAAAASAGPRPALQQLADSIAEKVTATLVGLSHETVSLAVVVEGDQAILGQEGRIAQELERLLVYRLEAGTAVDHATPLGASGGRTALERAIQQGATWLLRCVIGLKDDNVHLTVDLMPARMPFWDRLVEPVPRGVSHHLFESVQADQEILLLLGKSRAPPALGSWHLDELLYLPRRILDLGLGDLDADGTAELVVLFDDSIEVYGLSGGKLQRLASYGLEQVPETTIRTRDPVGSLLVVDFNRDGRFEVFYRHFNRRFGEVLTFNGAKLTPVRRLGKVPLCQLRLDGRPVVLYGTPESGTNRYGPEFELTDMNASSGQVHRLPGPFVTLRCWQREDTAPWVIAVDPAGELLRIGSDWRSEATLRGAGAGAGVMDLDQDGLADLVLSDAVGPDAADSLRVVSQGELVWRSGDVIGAVVAVAGGDLRGTGKVEAVVAAVEPGNQASRVYLLGR
jgi:hypothetical protein